MAHQSPYRRRVADYRLQGNAAAQRITQKIGVLEFEIPDQCSDVIGHGFESKRTVDILRVPVTLQVHSDHLLRFGKRGQIGAEHLARFHPTVQQDQRFPIAMDLVIHMQTIDRSKT
jgi:hypothetical protein